ncbi:hypothetical protein GBAR_LOCUS2146 [Geodia barretti]|uniref:Uncharacterized protein n=1 Tax=Geodia barretti TaxID=519541 RepID=A0AA35QZH8_GEOBA|nr:hypothetical protein GBAR_LOCUS2146 [Geodia barretti]
MYVYVYIFVKVLVVFYGEEEFEALAVSSNVTAEEVVNDNDIQIQLDKTGINNSGLFLKTDFDERLFSSCECPCDVLFTLHSNGQVVKLDAGRLVVKNKALHRGKMTVKLPKVHRAMSLVSRTMSIERREMEEISEEEDAQAKALYILLHKKQVREQPRAQQGGNGRPATIYDEDWTVMTPPDDHQSMEPDPIPRARSTAISSGRNSSSPQSLRKRMPSANSTSSPLHPSPLSSPSREGRGRCKSPRLLPTTPALSSSSPDEGQSPLLQRRNASKKNRSGPTIHIDSEPAVVSGNMSTLAVAPGNQHPALARTRSPTIRRSTDEHGPENGGNVLDKFLSDTGGDSLVNKVTPFQSSKPPGAGYRDNEDRLERLFDRSHQLEMEEMTVATATGAGRQTDDSLQSKMAAVISTGGGGREGEEGEGGGGDNSEGLKPMVIDVSLLAPPHTTNKTTTEPQQTTGTKNRPPQVPMEVRSPNILKVVLLASESTASDTSERTMDLLSLSGVVVRNDRGVWHLVEGSNFHDPYRLIARTTRRHLCCRVAFGQFSTTPRPPNGGTCYRPPPPPPRSTVVQNQIALSTLRTWGLMTWILARLP